MTGRYARGVRILICRCSILYEGRLTTRLGSGERVILIKDDVSVCVHTQRVGPWVTCRR